VLIVLISFLSYIGGFIAYNWALFAFWNQTLGGDIVSVLFWGGIAFSLLAVPIYLGIIRYIDTKTKTNKGWLYPIGCMLVFFIPTLFIIMIFQSTQLFSPEAMLFHAFFLTSGLIFGLCSWTFKNFFPSVI